MGCSDKFKINLKFIYFETIKPENSAYTQIEAHGMCSRDSSSVTLRPEADLEKLMQFACLKFSYDAVKDQEDKHTHHHPSPFS